MHVPVHLSSPEIRLINEPEGLICETAYGKLPEKQERDRLLLLQAALAVCHCDHCDRREEGQFMTSASSVARLNVA